MLKSINSASMRKLILATIFVILPILVVDSRIVEVSQQLTIEPPDIRHALLFTAFVLVSVFTDYVLLRYVVKPDALTLYRSLLTSKLAYTLVLSSQCFVLSLLILSVFETVILEGYDVRISLAIIYASHISTAVILSFLSLRLFQWLMPSRNRIVFVYALAFSMIVVVTLVSIPYLIQTTPNAPASIGPKPYRILKLDFNDSSLTEVLNAYKLSYYISALLLVSVWAVTVALLKRYSKRSGKIKYWLIVTGPLVYLLISVTLTNDVLAGFTRLTDLFYLSDIDLVFKGANQIAGIFFGIAFWSMSRHIQREKIRRSLMLCALGVVLLFSSIQMGLLLLPAFPPFGLVTMSFMPLASFILMIGITNCARDIAKDSEIRRELYKSAEEESSMLKSIGIAEMKKELEAKVNSITSRSEMLENDEPEYMPGTEEIQEMIESAMKEIRSTRTVVKDSHKEIN